MPDISNIPIPRTPDEMAESIRKAQIGLQQFTTTVAAGSIKFTISPNLTTTSTGITMLEPITVSTQPTVTPTQRMIYYCENCGCFFDEEDHRAFQAWYCETNISDDDNFYTENEPVPENVWECGGGCFHHDEGEHPTMEPGDSCIHCGDIYEISDGPQCGCESDDDEDDDDED